MQGGDEARRLVEHGDARRAEITQKARLPLIIRRTQRHDGSRADIFDGTPRHRIVFAHRVNLRVEELDADRRKCIDRKDVDDAAAHTELTDMLDLRRVFVAHADHAREQLLAYECVPEPQGERGARKLRRAQPLLRRRANVREYDDRLSAQETPEDVHALRRTLHALCRTLHSGKRIV